MRILANFFLLPMWCLVVCCNTVDDVQPPDTEKVPDTAVQAIKNRYPAAESILFKTLITNKLWQVNFESKSNTYETQVNTTAITAPVLRKGGDDFSFYKNLTDQLTIKGGEFSDLRVVDSTAKNISPTIAYDAIMNYRLNGKLYELHYTSLDNNNVDQVKLWSNFSTYYRLNEEDVPEKNRKFFSDNSIPFSNYDIYVFIELNGSKTYRAYLKWTSSPFELPLCFNDNFDPLWVPLNSDGSPVIFKLNSEIGYPALLNKLEQNFQAFTDNSISAFETNFNGLRSIRYFFARHQVENGSLNVINEFWQVFANPTSGQKVLEEYAGYTFKK